MRLALSLVFLAACAAPKSAEPVWGAQTTSLSDEADRFFAAVFDDDNRLYAAGWVAAGGDQQMAVARFGADGKLDTGFGQDGVAIVNVSSGGKNAELSRGLVLQADGKVVIAGPVEHDPSAAGDAAKDTDIAVVRFTKDGVVDQSFGTDGIVRLDLSTGVASGTSLVGDTSWGLTVLADDRLLVVGSKVADGRTEPDFAIVRLTKDGARDQSFGSDGVAIVDVEGGADSSRRATVLQDGRILVCGYTRNAAGIVSAVLLRLTAEGTLDASFGTGGIVNAALLESAIENYALAILDGAIVTTGYGKNAAADKVDLTIAKFTLDGQVMQDALRLDIASEDDRGRDIVALPAGGALVVGSGKPTGDNLDAMVVRLNSDATFDSLFGEGGKELYDLGGPNDSFFSVAVSPDGSRAAAVGYMGAATNGDQKDDAAVLFIDLR